MAQSFLNRFLRSDEQRPNVPGEHWLTLGTGLWLLRRSSASVPGRLLSIGVGAALVVRALSGRNGLVSLLSRTGRPADVTSKPDHFVEIAAPWPYDQRVLIATSEDEAQSRAQSHGQSHAPTDPATAAATFSADANANANADPERIDIMNLERLGDWAKRFDTTVQQLKDAVAAVGDRAADIEMYLKGSRSSSNLERVHDAS